MTPKVHNSNYQQRLRTSNDNNAASFDDVGFGWLNLRRRLTNCLLWGAVEKFTKKLIKLFSI